MSNQKEFTGSWILLVLLFIIFFPLGIIYFFVMLKDRGSAYAPPYYQTVQTNQTRNAYAPPQYQPSTQQPPAQYSGQSTQRPSGQNTNQTRSAQQGQYSQPSQSSQPAQNVPQYEQPAQYSQPQYKAPQYNSPQQTNQMQKPPAYTTSQTTSQSPPNVARAPAAQQAPIAVRPQKIMSEGDISSLYSLQVPSFMDPDMTEEIMIRLNNDSGDDIENMHIDFSDLRSFFDIDEDVNIPYFGDGVVLERRVNIKSKESSGSFPVRVKISANGKTVTERFTIKVGGTEIY